MLGRRASFLCLLAVSLSASQCAYGADGQANVEENPKQILRTGIDISSGEISTNSRQLADLLKLTPLLKRIQSLSGKVNSDRFQPRQEPANQELTAAVVEADHVIQEANLAVDFTLAEIRAEEALYAEMLSSYTNTRDKRILLANAVSYITNGLLWAICEGFDIPTYRHPRLSVPSGTFGILAGIVPSLASGYTLYELRGPHKDSEKDPNMLAKLFDCPAPPDEDYPKPVWEFLNAVPAGQDDTAQQTGSYAPASSGGVAAGLGDDRGGAGENDGRQDQGASGNQGYSGAVRLGTGQTDQSAISTSQPGDANNSDTAAQGQKEEKPKSRKDQLIDRWVADKNIPAFTDPKEKKQVDVITACNSRKRGLTIAMLNARSAMLEQLGSEILKMKRMLLELSMVVHGEKRV